MRALRTLLWLALALAALPSVGADASPRVGERAPGLIVPTLDGPTFDLAALRGKVVVVNFWASWCSPCRAEMPQLDAFYRRHHAQGLELLGLSVDDPQDRATVVHIMKSFSYPAAMAVAAKVNDFGAPLAVPMTWIIDAKGVVRARLIAGNTVTLQSLAQAVLPLLPQPQGTHAP
jgi:cytochrome c biogenesis protein CcmG, thiol:disulfide interchange protein DsbE